MNRRGVRATDRLTLGFIVLFAAILVSHAGEVPSFRWLLLGDALVVVLLLLLPRLPAEGVFAEVLGGGYPLVLASAFYEQLGAMHREVGHLHDALVQSWELAVFGSQVSTTWHVSAPYPLLSAALHLCYGSYYWILLLVPAWLLIRGKREGFRRAVFCSALAMYTCFLVFGVFPVAGPYFTFPAPTGVVVANWPARYVYFMLGTGSSIGTAFPSSHIAVSWVTVYAAWRDARHLALVLVPVVIGLALGTVYGQFHYAVDALAGAGLAMVLMVAADPLRAALGTRRPD